MQPEALPSASPARPIRLAVFTSHPIQYQAPLFRAMACRAELAPTVFFASRHGVDDSYDPGFGRAIAWDIPLLDGYEHIFLENTAWRPSVSRFLGVNVPGIAGHLSRARFDAVMVFGWHTLGHLQAIRAARRAGLPVVLRGESTLTMLPTGRLRTIARTNLWLPVRRPIYRRALRSVSAVVATGTRNAEYFRHFGVPAERIFRALYCVENERFALCGPDRERDRARIRAQIGAGEAETVFVVSGKLVGGKRPLDALKAFARLGRENENCHLLYLGDGPQRPRVESEAAQLGLRQRVFVSGFINQSEIPAWYAAADCLIHPSRSETWGLVVNEAMAAGLPVIASDAVGCVPDLVHPGKNGAVFPVGSIPDLRRLLREIICLPPEARAELGRRSREIVQAATFERVVDACIHALRLAATSAPA